MCHPITPTALALSLLRLINGHKEKAELSSSIELLTVLHSRVTNPMNGSSLFLCQTRILWAVGQLCILPKLMPSDCTVTCPFRRQTNPRWRETCMHSSCYGGLIISALLCCLSLCRDKSRRVTGIEVANVNICTLPALFHFMDYPGSWGGA